jgi:hypothetical protein
MGNEQPLLGDLISYPLSIIVTFLTTISLYYLMMAYFLDLQIVQYFVSLCVVILASSIFGLRRITKKEMKFISSYIVLNNKYIIYLSKLKISGKLAKLKPICPSLFSTIILIIYLYILYYIYMRNYQSIDSLFSILDMNKLTIIFWFSIIFIIFILNPIYADKHRRISKSSCFERVYQFSLIFYLLLISIFFLKSASIVRPDNIDNVTRLFNSFAITLSLNIFIWIIVFLYINWLVGLNQTQS